MALFGILHSPPLGNCHLFTGLNLEEGITVRYRKPGFHCSRLMYLPWLFRAEEVPEEMLKMA